MINVVKYIVILLNTVVTVRGRLNVDILRKIKPTKVTGEYANYTWPKVDVELISDGDIYIGGMFPLHQGSQNLICGPLLPKQGIQALEAMMFTVDQVNKDPNLLPGITLGVIAKDTCHNELYAGYQTQGYVRGWVDLISGPRPGCRKHKTKAISGLISSDWRNVGAGVSPFFKPFGVPIINYESNGQEIGGELPDTFTVFSNTKTLKVLVSVIKHLKWTYVTLVVSEMAIHQWRNYKFQQMLSEEGICIANQLSVPYMRTESDVPQVYDRIIQDIATRPSSRGIIGFVTDTQLQVLLEAARRHNLSDVVWLLPDRRSISVGSDIEDQLEGTIAVEAVTYEIGNFRDYFFDLSPGRNRRNPWFEEYWEQVIGCKFIHSRWTPFNQHYDWTCVGDEKLLDKEGFHIEKRLQYISEAVLAFAHALNMMHTDLCREPGVCDEMELHNGELLRRYLQKVNFKREHSAAMFSFDKNGEANTIYKVLNFQKRSKGYTWKTVGLYQEDNMMWEKTEPLRFRQHSRNIPLSVCSLPCPKGLVKFYETGDKCCWFCIKKSADQSELADQRGDNVITVPVCTNSAGVYCYYLHMLIVLMSIHVLLTLL